MKKKIIRISLGIIAVVLLAIAVFCFIRTYQLDILEKQTQIDKFGFYKSDLTILLKEDIISRWLLFIGIFSATASFGIALSIFSSWFIEE